MTAHPTAGRAGTRSTRSTRRARSPRRALPVLALIGVASLALAACAGGATATSGSAGDASATPRSGGDITYLTNDFPTSLDTTQTFSPYAAQQTVDNLVDQDSESGEIVPWLATAWTISDDGLSYTFDLRDGVTFSNGEALTATLVKNNFDTLVALGAAGKAALPAAWLSGYVGSAVVDDDTVTVSFDVKKAGFLQSLSEKPLAILAQETLDETADERTASGVIGSGPFVISSYTPGQEIVLDKRAGYDWAPETAGHEGEAYLDTITFRLSAEAGVRVGSLTSGQADIVDGLTQPDVDTVEAAGGHIASGIGGGTTFTLWPNFTSPILSDEKVRAAISSGIDRQEIVDTVWTSYDQPATSIISSPVAGWVDLSDELAYDTDASEKALDGAGWIVGDDGFRYKDGARLSLQAIYIYPSFQAEFELIQQQLVKIGVDFQPKYVTTADFASVRSSGDFDFLSWVNTRPDGDVLISNYSSTAADIFKAAPQPELDALLQKQSTELDVDARNAYLAEIQHYVLANALTIPLHETGTLLAAGADVNGIRFNTKWVVLYDTWLAAN